jgi:hypothetical protein
VAANDKPLVIKLNSAGRCSHCDGIVTNIESRAGCSLTRLAVIHEHTCPGVPHKRTPTQETSP